jgi:hypothetical protein
VRRWHLLVVALLGLGLALAPVAFRMFDRAPAGGDMITDFEPYMTSQKLTDFRGQLAEIDAAQREAAVALDSLPSQQGQQYPAATALVEQWPAIDDDMQSMLATMDDNIGNYRGVAALPPFALFPWFFVAPGLLVAGVAVWTLVVDRGRHPARGRRAALWALGLGLVAAPAVFGMFTRAPGGADMIDGFRPFMTETKVGQIQGYFLTIGAGEGELRRALIPDVAAAVQQPPDAVLPAVHQLNRDWPAISGDLAPMVGTMADNVESFAGIAALPPFWLFPWFFVVPGVAIVVLTSRSRRTVVGALPLQSAAVGLGRIDRRRALRVVATTAVVLELATLGAMNLFAGHTTTTTTVHRAPQAAAAPTPRTVGRSPAPSPSVPVPAPTAPASLAASPTRSPDVTTPPASPPASEPAPTSETALSCPLPLPEPPAGGGVASLTPLLPLFGPFSAEAFAMMPAFEPLLPLFGPMLVAGQQTLESADPALSLLIGLIQPLEESGFDAMAPFYGPSRQQFLDAEASAAQALAPITEAIAAAPGAGCLPALEGMLTTSAAPGP